MSFIDSIVTIINNCVVYASFLDYNLYIATEKHE